MSTNLLSRTLRRIVLMSLISVLLVVLTFVLMSQSSTARPLPEGERPEATIQFNMDGPETTLAGRMVTYTIRVTNTTGQVLQNVVITDSWYKLDYNGNYAVSGLDVITWTFVPTASAQPYIRWNFGPINNGVVGSIVMTMYVTPTLQPYTTKGTVGVPTILANTAVIATSSPGVPSANDAVNTLVVGPAMYLEKSFTPANIRPGRLVTFTLKLTNRSQVERADSISATNVIITELVPLKTNLWSVNAGPGNTYEFTDPRFLTYHLSSPVQPGQSVYLTFTTRLSPTLKDAADVASVRNNRTAFGFKSDEVTIVRLGEADVALSGNDVLEKSVQVGPPPPPVANPPRTFPDRVVTYTIGVYNPFTTTMSGFRVTDVLPIDFVGGHYFIYSDTLAVPPFSAPTVFSLSGRTAAWNLPAIDGWGVYSFALRVRVPPLYDTAGTGGRAADNTVYGMFMSAPLVTYDNLNPPEARVIVVPQLVPVKTIYPGSVFSGYPETYTIWLTNTGNTAITNLAVTDTLPIDAWGNRWTYVTMIHGPQPVITQSAPPGGNIVAWNGIMVPAFGGVQLAFQVTAIGVPPPSGSAYCNAVSGFSPDTFIPGQNNLACMTFLNPFRTNKVAIPTSRILGETFQYLITLYNVSLQNYEIAEVRDYLPPGFRLPGGGALFTHHYDTPAQFPAGGTHTEQFDVLAETVPRDVCNRLPGNIDQAAGRVQFDLVDPPETWQNSGPLAPLTVYPHVQLAKYSALPGAAPGEPVTYTIFLTNNTSTIYNDLVVSDVLPNGFQFARMAPGWTTQPSQIAGSNVVWTGLHLDGNGALSLGFVTTATMTVADGYENKVMAYSPTDLNMCAPWLGIGANAKSGPRVNIRNRQLTYSKSASPLTVGPLGLVQYNIVVNNKGPYPTYNVLVTDVLPSSIGEPYWRFGATVTLPSGVTQISSNPPAWRISQINGGSSVGFSFKARASIFPGGGYVNFMQGDGGPSWPFTKEVSYNGAPVTIVPGAALDKVVYPTTAFTGTFVVYTITLYNQSGSTLSGLKITDTLPTGFRYDSMISTAYPPDTISPLVWGSTLPPVATNTRLQLVFKAQISNTLASGTYYNKVSASALNISIPGTDNTAPVRVKGAPNVSTSKIADPTTTYRGATLAYTITLVNEGDTPITVRVSDTLPAGFTYANPLGGSPPPDSSSPLIWNSINLGSGETKQVGYQVNVATDAPTGTVYNRVDVASQTYTFPGTGPTAPVLVKPQPEYDLQVTKASTPPLVNLGDRITYTITYANITDDPVDLTNVVLTDTFPAGGVVYVDGSPGWIDYAPGVRVFNVGNLAANASGIVTMVLQVDPSFASDYLLNNASVSGRPNLSAIESDATNNTANAVTFVGAAPQVSFDKSADPRLVFAGEPLTYTLVLTNNSDAPLTLRITDTMPSGFVFSRTLNSTPQPVSALPLVWQNLPLSPGQAITLVWQALVSQGTLPGFYYNEIDLDANDLALPGRNDLAPVETDIRRYYDLVMSKTDGQVRANPGQAILYTLRYTNTTTNVTLTNVILTDVFSPTSYISFVGTGWNQVATGVYTRSVPALPPGGSGNVAFQVQLAPSIPPTVLAISNTAHIDATPAVRATETNASNDTSTDIDIVHGADLIVTNMTYTPSRLRQGGPITVVVTLKNQGLDATLGPDGLGWFGADLYVKPKDALPPSGPSDRYLGFCSTPTNPCTGQQRWNLFAYVKSNGGPGLAAGETWVLTYTYILPTGGTQWLYAQADPYLGGQAGSGTPTNGRIVEGNEIDNIFGPVQIFVQPNLYLPIVRKNS